MIPSRTICPEEIRAANHHTKNKGYWQDPLWKDAIRRFKLLHPICQYCGMPTFTGHHTDRARDYISLIQYIKTLFERGIPVCRSCHWYLEHGYERCTCRNGWRKPGWEYCLECIPLEIRKAAARKKEQMKELRRNLGRQAYQRVKAWKAAHPLPVKEMV